MNSHLLIKQKFAPLLTGIPELGHTSEKGPSGLVSISKRSALGASTRVETVEAATASKLTITSSVPQSPNYSSALFSPSNHIMLKEWSKYGDSRTRVGPEANLSEVNKSMILSKQLPTPLDAETTNLLYRSFSKPQSPFEQSAQPSQNPSKHKLTQLAQLKKSMGRRNFVAVTNRRPRYV